MAWNALWTILGVMLVFLALGVPISYSIGISSLAAILATVSADAAVVTAAQRIFVGMSRFSLTAIPFFILAGNLMNQGGIAGRLVDLVLAVLGRLPGSLLVANVGANALFGAISGSASAAAAAVGSMVRDGEEEQGYDPALCAASNGASAPSGLLIPPSNALITYSLAAGGVSVSALFLAGYVPGILWAACWIAVAVAAAGRKGYRGAAGKYDWKNLGRAALRAIPSLTLIVVVIGGIIAGIFTATEGAAIAVLYALILGICYGNITVRSFWRIVTDSARMSGMVVFLIGVSNILGWVMAFTQIPQAVSAALLGFTSSPAALLLIMNAVLLLAGTFMDVTPAILIFTPLWYASGPVRPDPGLQSLYWKYHASGGEYPVCRHKGGKDLTVRGHALYALVLRSHSVGTSPGDVCAGCLPGPALADRRIKIEEKRRGNQRRVIKT